MAPKAREPAPQYLGVCHPRAANDAFGTESPHWNLEFHRGNATAAEIVAYLPHAMKSIDVIDRFVTNGGKAMVFAAMGKFRNLLSILAPADQL